MRLAIAGELPGDANVAGGNDGCYDIASLAEALAAKGHEVRIYTASPSPSDSTAGDYEVVPLPVESSTVGPPESLMPLIGEIGGALVDEWTHRPPDVVHCHGWTYGMAGQLAANRRPVPTVQSFHGLRTLMRRSGHGQDTLETPIKLQTLLARNATTLAAACTDDLLELIRLGCPRAKVSVVPAGVTVDEDSLEETRGPRHDAGYQIAAVANGATRHDRLAEVVRALPALPHTRLRVVDPGGGERLDSDRISGLAADLGVGDRCRVVAVASGDDLCAVFRSADVVVCPASYDAYGTDALRAMASGAAVVAAAAGGLRDAVIPEVTGVLVPPANSDALRRALKSVLDQPVLREGMGLAGRSRARSRYSWDRIAIDAEVAYQMALDRHQAGAGQRMPA